MNRALSNAIGIINFAIGLTSVTLANESGSVYTSRIKPILNTRCIACHSCYNSPCQLNLAAYEGFDRGANKALVYQPQRIKEAQPTRLFEDAQTSFEWQQKFGFFPVVKRNSPTSGDPGGSAMYLLLAHKAAHPDLGGVFAAEQSHSCPKNPQEVANYLKKVPEGGMPLGFPGLSQEEFNAITAWIQSGAPGPSPDETHAAREPSSEKGKDSIAKWETFLNGTDIKARIAARYIYEHLFLAHIYFDSTAGENSSSTDFFRLVRSRTPAPHAVEEIATRRPYDNPGSGKFYYRFRKISATLVRKTHIPYLLNEAKMNRYRELFLDAPWAEANPAFPSYEREVAANPFESFKDIPASSRAHFMLDDAYYHVKSFIRGPVCKGNVALNVINTQFFIFFLRPESDLTVTHPEFLPSVAKHLKMPAEGGQDVKANYARYKIEQIKYEKAKQSLYEKYGSSGFGLSDIWDGDGLNDGAVLTVFRHFDSADVVKSARGGIPKTAWVLDYPTFERIYYDLVAGFDVYGNIVHQISTRMYMDDLRISGEDLFLSFLPKSQRKKLRDYWYRGKLSEVALGLLDPLYGKDIETRIPYANPGNAKDLFIEQILSKRMNAQVRGTVDTINFHSPLQEAVDSEIRSAEDFEREFRKVTKQNEPYAQAFPEVSFLRVRMPAGEDLVYTLIHNKEHLNVKFIFLEKYYMDPDNDDLALLPGFQGSYPNFFFDIPLEKAGEFLSSLQKLNPSDGSFRSFADRFGVRRMDPRFWRAFDWFNERYQRDEPIEAGVFDLTRYENL